MNNTEQHTYEVAAKIVAPKIDVEILQEAIEAGKITTVTPEQKAALEAAGHQVNVSVIPGSTADAGSGAVRDADFGKDAQ